MELKDIDLEAKEFYYLALDIYNKDKEIKSCKEAVELAFKALQVFIKMRENKK